MNYETLKKAIISDIRTFRRPKDVAIHLVLKDLSKKEIEKIFINHYKEKPYGEFINNKQAQLEALHGALTNDIKIKSSIFGGVFG